MLSLSAPRSAHLQHVVFLHQGCVLGVDLGDVGVQVLERLLQLQDLLYHLLLREGRGEKSAVHLVAAFSLNLNRGCDVLD